MDISAFYLDERNAITQPDKLVFVSQYFRRNWMRRLGPTGTAIVLYLRGACYHNRKSGETRDTVQIPQREIAEGCGCSISTLKREMEHNAALQQFVRISHEWERNGKTGRVRQLENIYKIAMDDPLTEADEARLKVMLEERAQQEQQKQGERTSFERLKKRIRLSPSASAVQAEINEGSNAVNTASSNAVNQNGAGADTFVAREASVTAPEAQNELLRPVAHFEWGSAQNELLYKESLLKTTPSKTLNVEEAVNFVSPPNSAPASRKRNLRTDVLDKLTTALVNELGDRGSEKRHRQLLDICERNGLDDLPKRALLATRRRLAQEQEQGVLEKPGAYYQKILLSFLEEHQVFVPPVGSQDEQAEVKRLVRESLQQGV